MIPYNIPCSTGLELREIQLAMEAGKLAGNGMYLRKCQEIVSAKFQFHTALFTPSGSSALEMCAMLCHFQPGDEVILPSFTHVSTANAFIRAGATLRFADCLPTHPNVDPESVRLLIGPATKAIVIVHYAGMACDPLHFRELADAHGILLIEDAAHAIGCGFNNKWLGSYGDFAAFSFHETKNIHCGHGGLLVVNRKDQTEEALEIWQHGTDRLRFENKKKPFYTWTRTGGSFVMPELNAAFLYPQLCMLEEINAKRFDLWEHYMHLLQPLQEMNLLDLPMVPKGAQHNGHIFYLLTTDPDQRNHLLQYLVRHDVLAVSHYVALHSSPFGKTLGPTPHLPFADQFADQIVRLPLYATLSSTIQHAIADRIHEWSKVLARQQKDLVN